MEAQLHGPQDHHDIAGLHSGEGEHNQPGEKKSVLTKVKDKAKKIKDTIKKHGHGQEHDNRHDQISEEEDVDDDDEDMVNAPEVHGAPSTNLPIQTDVNLEKPTNTRDSPNPSGPGKLGAELERSSVEARRPEFENQLPQSIPANVAEPMVQISPLIGLEEDPHSPKVHPGKIPPSNYQLKVTDPSGEGGKEAEVGPLLDNFHIHDQSESNPNPAPEQKSVPESNPLNPSENPDSTIAGKISSATSAIAGKAVSAKDMVASKLGYGGQPQDGEGGGGDTVAEGAERGASLKEYLVEKSRPGEEDKALSEAIREIFYKKKEGMQGKEEEVQPVGRVMEPEQEAAGSESSGGGVVDRLKGAVGAWLGKSSGTGSVDHSLGQSHVSDAGSVPGVGVGQSKEEIGLQESGN